MEINLGKTFDDAEKEAAEMRNPVPAGIYTLKVVDMEMRPSKKGDQYISWKLEVFGSMTNPALNGKKIFHNTPAGGTGIGFLLDFIKACGKRWEGVTFNPSMLLGSTLTANVSVKTYQGKESNEIKSFC